MAPGLYGPARAPSRESIPRGTVSCLSAIAPPPGDALLAVLDRAWGYRSFRPLQREAMEAILAGRESVVVMPTGGGKSLCFQAPALLRPGLAIVVSPLISLMKDQVDTLVGNGVAAACWHSALAAGEKAALAGGLREGRFRLLYVSPERLVGDGGDGVLRLLRGSRVEFVAIDEAHCISHWGHDFRPEYRRLRLLRDLFPGVGLHAYTATATERVRRDIAEQLGLADPLVLVGSFDRPNLVYRAPPRLDRDRQVREVLARHRGQAGIVYCTTRREVEELAAGLRADGVRAVAYHAGLPDEERARNQEAFLEEDADVVVATVAFGMGIDRSDVRFVVHAGAPKSLEHYQQESGRAGRDGLEAECVLLHGAADFVLWRQLLEAGGELTDAARRQLRDMERYAGVVGCRHRHLVAHFGEAYAPADCGACDWCLGELEIVEDPVPLARKVLSAVARVEQRYGVGHVAQVLLGKATPRALELGHDRLSTFGLLEDLPPAEVRGHIEQLVAGGWLRQTEGEYPVLQLTAEGVALLKDPARGAGLRLARHRRPARAKAPRRSRVEKESWAGVDRGLFERLRALRASIARERGVPPYVVFHDTTLREMARRRPATASALLGIRGVGARKAVDLGERFLQVIRGRG